MLTRIEESTIFKALRRGLMMSFPIILLGCFACVLDNIPIPGYSEWISGFAGGLLRQFLQLVQNCSVGCVALWMLCFISFSYGNMVTKKNALYFSIVSVCSYFIVVYEHNRLEDMLSRFSSRWTLTALVVALLSSVLYRYFLKISEKIRFHLYSNGADNTFMSVLKNLVPVSLTVISFGIIRTLFEIAFNGTDYYNIGKKLAMALFENIDSQFFAGLLFFLLVHILWFFGIHGSNMLENVAQMYQDQMNTGVIFTKTFGDVFVLMGGCGVTLCLIMALWIAGKNERSHDIAKLSIVPGLLNINETIIYGLPIFFNTTFLIPFIATPLVNYLVAYGATYFGLVPMVNTAVTWQMPVFISGYMATGSIAGSILQLVNLVIGVLMYIPFVRRMENKQEKQFKDQIGNIIDLIKKNESSGELPELLNDGGEIGEISRGLADDLHYTLNLQPQNIELFYQPQVYYDGKLAGAEALLRWNHPTGGYIYPPLIITLAYEMKVLDQLEFEIIDKSCAVLEKMAARAKYPMKMSVNISAVQLRNPQFTEKVKEIIDKYDFGRCKLVFELTERTSMFNDELERRQLEALRQMDIELSLDDFGMGHSSLMFLQDHDFKYVKLDGSIIKNVVTNTTSQKIVESMVEFTRKTGINLIAEYVETREETQLLNRLGCSCYQGYFYSKPLPEEEFYKYCQEMKGF